ncbi:hypothetical protein B0H13DRAFT_1655418 [Mycena leptocephala]|nr:hypothetical protein B0H13DRAFT_1655418 [Mycena leptocephala]
MSSRNASPFALRSVTGSPSPPPSTSPASPADTPPSPPQMPSVPACPEGAAKWFKSAYEQITAQDLGGSFNTLLSVFLELERSYKLDSGGAGRAGTGRSDGDREERWGQGGAMGNGRGPAIGDLKRFGESWWKWWEELQPSWRVQDGDAGKFKRRAYPVALVSNWKTLRAPGQNGVLSVVASLYWWGKKVQIAGEDDDRESWAEAVADVEWMLHGLLAAEGENIGNSASTGNESDQLRSESE